MKQLVFIRVLALPHVQLTTTIAEEQSSPSQEVAQSRTVTATQEDEQDKSVLQREHEMSVHFSETGLSSVFRPAYSKAVRLLTGGENIVKAPGQHQGFLVTSDTEVAPHFVAFKPNGSCVCQRKGFKTASLNLLTFTGSC